MERSDSLAAALAIALLLRLISVFEVASSPQAFVSELPENDAHFYASWGEELAAGDWLGRDLVVPYTAWAALHEAWPDAKERRKEWLQWFQPPRFNPAPLYLYMVAGVYSITGPEPRAVFWFQAVLGVLICALLYGIGSRTFGRRAGLVTACLGAVYGPLIFYESVVLRATLIVLGNLLFVHALLRARRAGRTSGFVLPGFIGALAMLTQPTILAFLPLVLGWMFCTAATRRTAVLAMAALMFGWCIPWAALSARNLAVGVSPLAIESRGPFALVFGNLATSPSGGIGFSIDVEGATILRETGYETIPALAAALATHESPQAYLAFEARKLLAVWSDFEIYNNANYYDAVDRSVFLGYLPHFSMAAGLGLVGCLLAQIRRRKDQSAESSLLLLFGLYAMGAAMVSVVLSRYRLVLSSVLLLYAGYAIVWGFEAWRKKRYPRLLATAAGALFVGLVVGANLGVELPRHRPAEAIGRARILASRGKPAEAAAEIEAVVPHFQNRSQTQAQLLRQAARYRKAARQPQRVRELIERAKGAEALGAD